MNALYDLLDWIADSEMAQHTLLAVGSLLLGLTGIVVNRRQKTNGTLCLVLGALVAGVIVWMWTGPAASMAPGVLAVFLISYFGGELLVRLTHPPKKTRTRRPRPTTPRAARHAAPAQTVAPEATPTATATPQTHAPQAPEQQQ